MVGLSDSSKRGRLRHAITMLCIGGAGLLTVLSTFTTAVKALSVGHSAPQSISGSILHNTDAEFLAPCTVLPEYQSTPQTQQITVSPAKGGELRLQATLEDYFDAPQIDNTKWISGYSNPAYPGVEMPQIVDGVLRLNANYLRARHAFAAETPIRFFETRARFVTAPDPLAYGDLGFYRSMPPLRAVTETSSIRLFVAQTAIEADIPRHLYVRTKDGPFFPSDPPTTGVIDTAVDNWGASSAAQMAGLNQFRLYTIRWDQSETHYLIDGSPIVTTTEGASKPLPHGGVSTLPTYVFLYSQDPTFFGGGRSPVLVDWVRAGAYATQGSYLSCVFDAGELVNWSRIALSANIPQGTSVTVETRTSQDGAIWSGWYTAGVSESGASTLSMVNPGGRYFQYRVRLSSTSVMDTPEVEFVEAFYFGAQKLRVNPAVAYVNPLDQKQFNAETLDLNDEVIGGYQPPIQWAVVNDGGTIDNQGLFTAGVLSGRFTDTVLATSPGLLSGAATVNVGYAPDVHIALCCEGKEGVPITLTASLKNRDESLPPVLGWGAAIFEWDIDGDGGFGDLVGESVTHVFPKTGEYEVAVLVTSGLGFTNTASTTIAIANVAPQIVAIHVDSPVTVGKVVTVEVHAVDVPSAILTYAFDWNSDGVFDAPDQLSNQMTTTYDAPGVKTITVRVRDDDGAETLGTTEVQVELLRLFLPVIER